MSSARHVIIHYHLFKNAGTTLAAVLQTHFGNRFAQVDASQPGARVSSYDLLNFLRQHPTVVAVSSHTLWPPLPQADGICFHEIVIVRDPLDRVRSMYDFYRRSEPDSHPLTRAAKELGIQSFVKGLIHDYRYLVNNAQLRMLAAGGARRPRRDDLENAVAFLKKASVVGTVENYNQSLASGEHKLRKVYPGLDLSYVPRNVSQRASNLHMRLAQFEASCGTQLYAELRSLNELDLELVAVAAEETRRRFQEVPAPEKTLRDFQKRVWWRVQIQHCGDRYDRARDFFRRRKKQLRAMKLAPARWQWWL